jgi:hypothetical protein
MMTLPVRRCRICTDPRRSAIEGAIARGGVSDRELARRFDIERGVIGRHRRHVPELAGASLREAEAAAGAMRLARESIVEVLAAARRESKNSVVLEAADKLIRSGELVLKRQETARLDAASAGGLEALSDEELDRKLHDLSVGFAATDPEFLAGVLPRVAATSLWEVLVPQLAANPSLRHEVAAALVEASPKPAEPAPVEPEPPAEPEAGGGGVLPFRPSPPRGGW